MECDNCGRIYTSGFTSSDGKCGNCRKNDKDANELDTLETALTASRKREAELVDALERITKLYVMGKDNTAAHCLGTAKRIASDAILSKHSGG